MNSRKRHYADPITHSMDEALKAQRMIAWMVGDCTGQYTPEEIFNHADDRWYPGAGASGFFDGNSV